MSAQYRPYRDEDGLESEQINWADNEPSSVQIYEKTTEDIQVVSSRRLVLGGIGISIVACVVGFLLGYFGHSEHTDCVPSLSVALHSVRDENATIRQRILELVAADRIRENVKNFSAEPHDAGSRADLSLAWRIYNLWSEQGLDRVELPSYNVLLSQPNASKPNRVEIIDDKGIVVFSSLQMDREDVPPFAAYSPPGIVTGDLVFANSGTMFELHHLQSQMNITLKGKILICKQATLLPHEQLINAVSVEAAALILYPDPAEYNPPQLAQPAYPDSFWMPGDAVSLASVLWNGGGDPLTPGYPAKEYAFRLSRNSTLSRLIPVQPVSANTAYHLLSKLGGAKVPDAWKGGFNFTYHVGPGFYSENSHQKVSVVVNNEYVRKTVYNVIGYLKGKVEPDRYVLIGSHRDSWTDGALDAAGGTAALLELSRVFGILLKDGWRPRRTIIFCSWGAEKYNLIGSMEWLEEKLKILHGRAVAYISADIFVVGTSSVRISASPLLYHAVFNATKEVPNPNEDERHLGLKTVYDAWLKKHPLERNESSLLFPQQASGDATVLDYDEEVEEMLQHHHQDVYGKQGIVYNYVSSSMARLRPRVHQMNVRSSYAPFFIHAGIPSISASFVDDFKESKIIFPLHHTVYDTFHLADKLVDPGFKYHAALTSILGEMLRDLSDSLFLPFNLFDYAQLLRDFYSNLYNMAAQSLLIHGIRLDHLDSAIRNFTEAALKFHGAQEKLDTSDPMAIRRINDQLLLLERAFLYNYGLPRNMLKKHVLLSPSETNPEADDMFPGLWDEFAHMAFNKLQKQSFHNSDESNKASWEVIQSYLSIVISTIQSATMVIMDVA